MSIVGILTLVLVAAVIVSILFVVFKMFFALLPAIVVVVLVLWLINKFSHNEEDESPTQFYADDDGVHERKKAQNFKAIFEDDEPDKDANHKEDDPK